ncbi:MAG: hypothetical protein EZS28_023757, partial [Streblomastix strix]
MNEGAGGSQFLMWGTQPNEDSSKQSSSNEFEWLQGFNANGMSPELMGKVMRVKVLQREVQESYCWT